MKRVDQSPECRLRPDESDMRRLKKRLAASLYASYIADRDDTITYVNAAFEVLTGYSRVEAVGQKVARLEGGTDTDAPLAAVWRELLAGRDFSATMVVRRKDDTTYRVHRRFRPFVNNKGVTTHLVAVSQDASISNKTTGEFEYAAARDFLSGLPDRVLFKDAREREFAYAGLNQAGFAVCFVDVDCLKSFSCIHGDAAGDRVLQTVAEVLEQSIRDTDTAARWRGGEFSLMLSGVKSPGDVQLVLQKMFTASHSRFGARPCDLPWTVSIGVALWHDDG